MFQCSCAAKMDAVIAGWHAMYKPDSCLNLDWPQNTLRPSNLCPPNFHINLSQYSHQRWRSIFNRQGSWSESTALSAVPDPSPLVLVNWQLQKPRPKHDLHRIQQSSWTPHTHTEGSLQPEMDRLVQGELPGPWCLDALTSTMNSPTSHLLKTMANILRGGEGVQIIWHHHWPSNCLKHNIEIISSVLQAFSTSTPSDHLNKIVRQSGKIIGLDQEPLHMIHGRRTSTKSDTDSHLTRTSLLQLPPFRPQIQTLTLFNQYLYFLACLVYALIFYTFSSK